MSAKEAFRAVAGDIYRRYTLHHLYPDAYRKAAQIPVNEKKIVFLEVRTKELSDSFTRIYEALEKKGGYELCTVCIREGMADRNTQRKLALEAIPVLADASLIFVNDSCYFLSSLPLRSETRVMQLWHACGAFKKFGYSLAGKLFGVGKDKLDEFPVHKNFTYVTVSSPEVVWAYAEAFHMEDRRDAIVPLGISRSDVFFDEQALRSAREKLEKLTGLTGRKVVLYAPTFRGKVAYATSPKGPDLKVLRQELGSEYIVVIKHHPFVKERPAVPKECEGFAFDLSEKMSIEDLLMASDICVTDYSSLIFEYALMGRPMAFFAPDLRDYYDWRGFYYPYDELTPGPVFADSHALAAWVRREDKTKNIEEVAAFRERFMASCDGQATKRILEFLKL